MTTDFAKAAMGIYTSNIPLPCNPVPLSQPHPAILSPCLTTTPEKKAGEQHTATPPLPLLPVLLSYRRTETSTPAPSSLRSSRRSEEHTSELQSRRHLVCRLL